MPRKPLLRSAIHPYHVVNRSRNKDWYDLPLDLLWLYCERSLQEALYRHKVQLHAFVLMKNHYHLLVTTPNLNLDKFMYEFNKRFSMAIRYRSERINQIFGGRYKWCLVDNDKYLLNVYRYIYQNPVKARLSSNIAIYPYSSFSQDEFKRKLKFRVHYNEENPNLLKWFDRQASAEENKEIQRAMKGQKFKLKPMEKSRRVLKLEEFHY